MKASEATRLLCGLIEREQHPNVCAAAIDVLTEVGTPEAIPALEKCAARFARNAVPAVRRLGRDRPHIGRGRLSRNGESRRRGVRDPSISRRRKSSDSASFSTAAPACRSQKASDISSIAVSRTASRPPARSSFQAYFSLLACRCRPRDRASDQFVHRQRDLFLSRGSPTSLHDLQACSAHRQLSSRPEAPSGSGRYLARPGKNLIPSHFG